MKDLKECETVIAVLDYLDQRYSQIQDLQSKGMLTIGMCTTIENKLKDEAMERIMNL